MWSNTTKKKLARLSHERKAFGRGLRTYLIEEGNKLISGVAKIG